MTTLKSANPNAVIFTGIDDATLLSAAPSITGGLLNNANYVWNTGSLTWVKATQAGGAGGLVQIQDSTGNNLGSTAGSLNVNITGGSSGNAAAGLTGVAVPLSAGYTGWNNAGNLTGVSTANPLPVSVQGSVAVTGIFFQGTQPVNGTVSINAIPTGANTIGAVNINGTVPISGAITGTIAATQSGIWNDRVNDGLGNAINSLQQGVNQNGLLVASGATSFFFSTVNTTAVQLLPNTFFVGAIETVTNASSSSILMTSDQNIILTINQYQDAAGLLLVSQWIYNVPANQQFSRSFVINGNYLNLVAQNIGPKTTTNFNLNVAYGTIPSVTSLGNTNVSINEINGTAIPLGGSIPVNVVNSTLVSDPATLAAQTSESPFYIVDCGDPNGDFAGLNLLEQVIDPGTGQSLQTSVVNLKKDQQNALIISDMAGPYIGNASAASTVSGITNPVDSTGYNSIQWQVSGGAATIIFEANNDLTFGNWVQVNSTIYVAGSTSISTNIAINSAVPAIVSVPCVARYMRCRVFLYTSGIIQAVGYLRATTTVNALANATTNISSIGGSNTVTAGLAGTLAVGGNTAENVTTTTNGLMVAGFVRTTALAAQTAGTGVRHTMSSGGALVVSPHSIPDVYWQATSSTAPLATTTSTQLVAAGAAGIRNYCKSIQLFNTSATVSTTVSILDGATIIWTGYLPATTAALPVVPINAEFEIPLKGTAATVMNIQLGTIAASVYYNTQGFQAP